MRLVNILLLKFNNCWKNTGFVKNRKIKSFGAQTFLNILKCYKNAG